MDQLIPNLNYNLVRSHNSGNRFRIIFTNLELENIRINTKTYIFILDENIFETGLLDIWDPVCDFCQSKYSIYDCSNRNKFECKFKIEELNNIKNNTKGYHYWRCYDGKCYNGRLRERFIGII